MRPATAASTPTRHFRSTAWSGRCGCRRSRVPAFVFTGGAIGVVFAQWVQWYQSTVGYPLIIDGKPLNSSEAFVPISFETMILYASIGSVLGMLFSMDCPGSTIRCSGEGHLPGLPTTGSSCPSRPGTRCSTRVRPPPCWRPWGPRKSSS